MLKLLIILLLSSLPLQSAEIWRNPTILSINKNGVLKIGGLKDHSILHLIIIDRKGKLIYLGIGKVGVKRRLKNDRNKKTSINLLTKDPHFDTLYKDNQKIKTMVTMSIYFEYASDHWFGSTLYSRSYKYSSKTKRWSRLKFYDYSAFWTDKVKKMITKSIDNRVK